MTRPPLMAHKAIVGQIFLINETGKDEWVCDLQQNSTSGKYFLQPGKYKIVYRLSEAVSTDYTTVKPFTVKPGGHTALNL